MISLTVVFYLFVFLFAIIGGMRGWAKELLVSFSVILALFIIFVLSEFAPDYVKDFYLIDVAYGYVQQVPEGENAKITAPDQVIPFESVPDDAQKAYRRQFWLRSLILGLLVFFGYQTPSISRISSSARREKVQDFLFGVVLGAINGYLIVGTIWSYMHSAHYPFAPFIISPNQTDPLLEVAGRLLQRLPPAWLGVSPFVYAAVVAAFLFVLVVFI